MSYVAYCRVSTAKQGKSGLGLEAQRQAIRKYLKGQEPVKEFTDVESGTKKGNNRGQLRQAIDFCKRENSKLVIAKLDRLSRNVSFISQLIESDIDFVACDMEHANKFTIHIFAALAEQEADLISQRTKAALKELKRKGIKLGTPENLTTEAIQRGLEVRKANAANNENNRKATALICSLRNERLSFYGISKKLNMLNFKTRRDKKFTPTQVKRLFERSIVSK